jgi:hypothetical protein
MKIISWLLVLAFCVSGVYAGVCCYGVSACTTTTENGCEELSGTFISADGNCAQICKQYQFIKNSAITQTTTQESLILDRAVVDLDMTYLIGGLAIIVCALALWLKLSVFASKKTQPAAQPQYQAPQYTTQQISLAERYRMSKGLK